MAVLDQPIRVTCFDTLACSVSNPAFEPVRVVAEWFRTERAATKEQLRLFLPAGIGRDRTDKHSLKHDANLIEIAAIVLDSDAGDTSIDVAVAAMKAAGVGGFIAATARHTEAFPRWRAVLPLHRPLHKNSGFSEHAKLVSRAAGIFPGVFDGASWVKAQGWFVGTVTAAPAHRVDLIEGDFLDDLEQLDANAKPKPTPSKPERIESDDRAALDFAAALNALTIGQGSHDGLIYAAGLCAGQGIPIATAAAMLLHAVDQRSEAGRDAGWKKLRGSLGRTLRWAYARQSETDARETEALGLGLDGDNPESQPAEGSGNGAADPNDPWAQGARPAQPEPVEIDLTVMQLNRRDAPQLPLDVFGPHWGKWIRLAADAACCPQDYVVSPLLSVASALIGNARWAQGSRRWREPPHLWMASVGDSGDGKSPGSDVLLKEVRAELEDRMIGDFPARMQAWQANEALARARKAQWEKDIAQAVKTHTQAPPMPDDLDIGPEPQEPRLCCHDVTIERVATLLATAAPKGLLMVRDELAGFLLGMTAYSDAARPFWLESFGGRPYSVDRQKYARQIRVRHNAVSWFGTIQPGRLNQLMAEVDDGLLARFVWVWPEAVDFDMNDRAPDVAFAVRALDRLRTLDMIEIAGKAEPVLVPLCAVAFQRMRAFGREMQRQKRQCVGLMSSAFGKARGLALRLSLVLELLWWCGFDNNEMSLPIEIGESAFEAACRLVSEYLLPMAERTYGDAAMPVLERNTATLAGWIVKVGPSLTEVHVRTVQRTAHLSGLRTADTIHAACKALIEAGWLLPSPAQKGFQVRPKAFYPINPKLWEALDGQP